MKIDQPLLTVCDIDVAPLQRKLAGTPQEMWERDTFRQEETTTQKDTESILLCWSGFNTPPSPRPEMRQDFMRINRWTPAYEFFKSELEPIHARIGKEYHGAFLRSMFARLNPDGYISPHRDIDSTFDMTHRLHLPIVTDQSTQFMIDDINYQLKEGQLYEFDNLLKHSVRNTGTLARVHLVIDVVGEKYMRFFKE